MTKKCKDLPFKHIERKIVDCLLPSWIDLTESPHAERFMRRNLLSQSGRNAFKEGMPFLGTQLLRFLQENRKPSCFRPSCPSWTPIVSLEEEARVSFDSELFRKNILKIPAKEVKEDEIQNHHSNKTSY